MLRFSCRAGAILLVACVAACATTSPKGASSSSGTDNRVSGEWKDLQSLGAWRGYKSQAVPAGWRMVDGVIQKEGSAEDLVSRDMYGNFELSLDWMLAEKGNAGIFYRATEEYEHI